MSLGDTECCKSESTHSEERRGNVSGLEESTQGSDMKGKYRPQSRAD